MTKTKVTNWLQKNTMVLILVLVFVFFAFQKDGAILLPQNITNLIAQNAYVFILATGMLLCILTGGNIDLSVGSVVCFTGAIGALLMAGGMNMWLAVIIMLAIGLAIGAFQAYWIAYVRVPPFITTLAGMLIFRVQGHLRRRRHLLHPRPLRRRDHQRPLPHRGRPGLPALPGRRHPRPHGPGEEGLRRGLPDRHRPPQRRHRGGGHVLHRQAQPV